MAPFQAGRFKMTGSIYKWRLDAVLFVIKWRLKWRGGAVQFGTLEIAPIQDGDYLP